MVTWYIFHNMITSLLHHTRWVQGSCVGILLHLPLNCRPSWCSRPLVRQHTHPGRQGYYRENESPRELLCVCARERECEGVYVCVMGCNVCVCVWNFQMGGNFLDRDEPKLNTSKTWKKTHLRAIATCITCMHMHAEHVIRTMSCNVYMRMAKEQTLAAWAVYSSISLLSSQPASPIKLKIWALV